ncbi:hypothetical protein PMAYCL1PPCAC_02108, partial [Pristionchus mayeri]
EGRITWNLGPLQRPAMSKLLGATTVLVLAALGVAIASLVFNILVFNKVNSDKYNDAPTTMASPTSSPDTDCPTLDTISTQASWKEAANRILSTVDLSADPCQDFYQFTCGKYIQDTNLDGMSRKGTYDEAQYQINLGIADYFDSKKLKDLTSDTEKIQKNFLTLCYDDGQNDPSDPEVRKTKWTQLSVELNKELGFPLVGTARQPQDVDGIFTKMGEMERDFTGGPFMTSFVTADFGDNNTNALYINQPALQFARDFFVKPQFIDHLQAYAEDIRDLIIAYSSNMGLKIDRSFCGNQNDISDKDCAEQVAQWAVNLERSIAMASWPDTELRNYKQQYTPFESLNNLDSRYSQLKLSRYVRALLQLQPDQDLNGFKVVISQPTYLSAIDGMFDSGKLSLDEYTNYLAIHFLMENAGDFGIDIPSADDPVKKMKKKNEKKYEKYITRRGHGARRIKRRPLNSKGLAASSDDEIRTGCVDAMIDYMPFGPGYTYVKNRDDKYDVRADARTMAKNIIHEFNGMLNSLDWIDDESLAFAHLKSEGLQRNYLWPDKVFGDDFSNSETVDKYHHRYQLLIAVDDKFTYWDAIKQMKMGLMYTEQWDIVDAGGDRSNFLQSPATVNAWYQPERNSITFPFGILNPPYYNLNYPQAYNYAGQGGTAGHELTHGYDDEGTQFDENGMLADCEFTHCSILDDDSRSGFVDMAQCVVQQFNTQCCPLKKGNVRCANGDTTQGENIADIGGQQAAYRAYNQFMANLTMTEDRLPGLEKFSPQQIFWMTYGVSWCMKITDERLTKQLMTDPHAPSSCRVNQVMQDIPQFGMDFKCKRGVSPMYPTEYDRCKVWVGY